MHVATKSSFQRNKPAIKTGLAAMLEAKPDADMMVGPSAPLAAFIKEAGAAGLKSQRASVSHLMAMTAFTSLGLVAFAGLGYFAVTSIQRVSHDLTLLATPLQSRTYELQERTERGMGALLRLSLARSADEAAKSGAAFDAEMGERDRLVAESTKSGRLPGPAHGAAQAAGGRRHASGRGRRDHAGQEGNGGHAAPADAG